MSRINVNSIANKSGLGAVDFPHGITVTGVVTATTLNANVSGAVTATSFHGDGSQLTNLPSPSSINASNLDSGTVPDARFPASLPAVDGSALTNVNAVGLTGAPSLTVTNLNATGNVSIAGTLTYEDVTNIDSVGLVTARTGLEVTSGSVYLSGITKEKANVTTAPISSSLQFDIADGLVQFRNSAAPGGVSAAAQLVYGGSTVNAWMAINDVVTMTIMCTGASGSYINGLTIDGSSQTVNWAGGSAPSDGSAKDMYVFTVVKTADSAFTVFGNQTKTA